MPAKKTKVKTKKQNNKGLKAALLHVFNPTTSGGKLLIFMTVFAVIGGSYMAYKSFAATNTAIFGVGSVRQLEGGGDGGLWVGLTSPSTGTETAGNKRNLTYMLGRYNRLYHVGYNSALSTTSVPSTATQIRSCIMVRSLGTNARVSIGTVIWMGSSAGSTNGLAFGSGSVTRTIYPSTDYGLYCSNWDNIPPNARTSGWRYTPTIGRSGTSDYRFTYLSLQWR